MRSLFRRKHDIAVIGADGMLGREVVKLLEKQSGVKHSCVNKCIPFSRSDYQLGGTDNTDFHSMLDDGMVDLVINCAAFTDTAGCADISKLNESFSANVSGVQELARACAYRHVKLVHVSTDYVYSALSLKNDSFQPIEVPCNEYGMQKLLGEKNISLEYASWPEGHLIARLSWLYGETKRSLFMHKILAQAYKSLVAASTASDRSAADTDPYVLAACDCYGSPISAKSAASIIYHLIYEGLYGIVNCWPALNTSRLDFAASIVEAYANCVDSRLRKVHVKSASSSDFKQAVCHPTFENANDAMSIPHGYIAHQPFKISFSKFNSFLKKACDIVEDKRNFSWWLEELPRKEVFKQQILQLLSKDELDALSKIEAS